MSAWQMYGFWGWQMSKFGGGKCPIYGGGKCPPGKCLTIPLYYGKSSNFKQISEMWTMLCLSVMQSNNLSLCLSQDKASKELNSPRDKTYSAD